MKGRAVCRAEILAGNVLSVDIRPECGMPVLSTSTQSMAPTSTRFHLNAAPRGSIPRVICVSISGGSGQSFFAYAILRNCARFGLARRIFMLTTLRRYAELLYFLTGGPCPRGRRPPRPSPDFSDERPSPHKFGKRRL